MSEECKWLHEILEELPLIKYPFRLELLPLNGIYFFYEEGEIWGHGGEKLRIVRIGTHKGNNFRNRIAEHFLINEKKMSFDRNNPKPSDRSIFRKNIERVLLNKNKDPYLKIWEIDFLPRANRDKYDDLRDIEKEKSIEKQITEILRNNFFFRFVIIENEDERIGSKGLESKLIGTVSRCTMCKPSMNWLGNYSPKKQIRTSGLWLIQHLNAEGITEEDIPVIEKLIRKTKTWIKNRW
ncbi:hypothetical protein M1N00_03905 [Thermodesulfovibrionales bacterium]|nr:hypothetical protein [Thermodesulfovibrionales bacterium]